MADVQPRFNLVDEPWILVLDDKGRQCEVSLREALLNAHRYSDLSGEVSAQNAVILRYLLAVLHSVYYRVDNNGEECQLDEYNALDRWKSLWDDRHFSAEAVEPYLQKWHERFWLIHPTRPFAQVYAAQVGTGYEVAKLNGQLSESSKKRLFQLFTGAGKKSLSFAESARWLLYVNAFDDTSGKPKQRGLPSPGAGWLGKIGVLAAKGGNLFETLMLNFVLRRGGDGQDVYGEPAPCWELGIPREGERTRIAVPDNLASLFTLQSRRILLQCEDDRVVGYRLLGGDFFDKTESYGIEVMTSWSCDANKDGVAKSAFTPRRHDTSRQMWRDFAMLFLRDSFDSKRGKCYQPAGVVKWIAELKRRRKLSRTHLICFTAFGIDYGDKDTCINDVSQDSLLLSPDVLTELNDDGWMKHIVDCVAKIEEVAGALATYAYNLSVASGGDASEKLKSCEVVKRRAKERFYGLIDHPFREWLSGLNADNVENATNLCSEFRSKVRGIALNLVKQLALEAGLPAVVGRVITDKKTKKEEHYSASLAELIFRRRLHDIIP